MFLPPVPIVCMWARERAALTPRRGGRECRGGARQGRGEARQGEVEPKHWVKGSTRMRTCRHQQLARVPSAPARGLRRCLRSQA